MNVTSVGMRIDLALRQHRCHLNYCTNDIFHVNKIYNLETMPTVLRRKGLGLRKT